MKNPPIMVAVLGFFGALAGFGYLFFGLRAVGFDWFGAFGDLPALEHVGLWGWLAILTGIIWILAALGLWSLQPWARLFAQIIAGFGLLEALIAFFQFPGSGIGFGMALLPGVILWYLSTAEIKAAFGLLPEAAADGPVATPAPAAAPMAAPAAPSALATVAAPAAAVGLAATAAVAAAASDAPAAEPPAPAPMAAAPVAAAAMSSAESTDAPAAAPAAAAPAQADAGSSGHRQIEDVEGIGPAYGARLVAAGVRTTDDLLSAGATRSGRQHLVDATGINGALILEWVNHVDLMRVPGIGPQYSDLLEAAGVDSPAELSHRNAANLAGTFKEVVAARPGTVRRIPTEAEVAGWIAAAQTMPKVVEH